MSPVWKSDGSGYYYISEQDGTLNVYSSSLDGKTRRQLTSFEHHPVRTLSASSDGLMAFSWDGDIYTLREGEQPRKLDITVAADQYDGDLVKRYVTSGAPTWPSPPTAARSPS